MCAQAGSDPSSSSFTIDQIGGMMGHATPEKWQAAIEALILVVELGGPTMMARIGVMRALNRHVERVFNPERKETHWGKRKLKRDQ
jgi:hypothetical protein